MEFSGEFELTGVSPEEAWVVLSDPVAIRDAMPGCKFLTRVDDVEDFNFDDYEPEADPATLPEADIEAVAERTFVEGGTYAALTQIGVGSVKPRFESEVTITEREFPRMEAEGSGDASQSAFAMSSWMEIEETDEGSLVGWGAEADVSGRIAQLGNRVLDPVADKVVNNFFGNVQEQMQAVEVDEGSTGVADRLRNLVK